MSQRSDSLNTKKRLKAFVVLLVITATILFVECNVYFPKEINVLKGENVEVPEGFAYTLEASNIVEQNENYDATVKLFGFIPVKEVVVNVLPERQLIAGGKAIGIKMFTKGLICVGTQSINDENGQSYNIAKALNIKESDMIISANGTELDTIEQFSEIIENSGGNPVTLSIVSGNNEETKVATPIKTPDGYKLGLWVRDSTAGIGTVTYVDSTTQSFAALGHPITDVDTGTLMPIDNGTISNAEIIDIKKGSIGSPGELYGIFSPNGDCGIIAKNTKQGIYGQKTSDCRLTYNNEPLLVASAQQVKTGSAQIYANIDGNKIEKFDIQILRLMRYAPDSKNMIVKITDKRLLNATGGIVQGMSGSPILQNGKIVGAVTHVFVNDPSRGYGIFIENMLF